MLFVIAAIVPLALCVVFILYFRGKPCSLQEAMRFRRESTRYKHGAMKGQEKASFESSIQALYERDMVRYTRGQMNPLEKASFEIHVLRPLERERAAQQTKQPTCHYCSDHGVYPHPHEPGMVCLHHFTTNYLRKGYDG